MKRRFCCYLWFTSWAHISLGLHLDLGSPNIEIHLPFCFWRIGWIAPCEPPSGLAEMGVKLVPIHRYFLGLRPTE